MTTAIEYVTLAMDANLQSIIADHISSIRAAINQRKATGMKFDLCVQPGGQRCLTH